MDSIDDISIEVIETSSRTLIETVNALLLQLNPQAKQITQNKLQTLLQSKSSKMLGARDRLSGKIIAILTMHTYQAVFVKKTILEDLVVDEKSRGRGIASRLVMKALEISREEQAQYVELTSNPTRQAANRLYRHLGFEKRETNIYRYRL